MNSISSVSSNSISMFGKSTIRFRTYEAYASKNEVAMQAARPSAESLLKIHRLEEALKDLKPGKLRRNSSARSAQSASVVSTSSINFSTGSTTTLRSVEEINTAPTSFQHNGPIWNGSTTTAPWSGLGSTADAMVGGSYDGSNGQGVLKFEVNREGIHGNDDLRIKVYDEAGNQIETIDIGKNDPLNEVYELSNGLTFSLGSGSLVKDDYFEVDTSVVSTSYTPNDPGWTGSTADASIGGLYEGSYSGDLTFVVDREGIHGEDDLKLIVYDSADNEIDSIDIKKKDAIDKIYALENGLTLTLGAGDLINNETFVVSVNPVDPSNFTTAPEWEYSSIAATITGTYDGSNGNGTLTFETRDDGVHGEDDLRVTVFAPDGTEIDEIAIGKNDPIDTTYELANGLSVTFSAGQSIKNERFTVDVVTNGVFSTAPNPVQSTAAPELSGVYDGSLGTDTLEFKVTQAGEHGTDDLSFEVRDSEGTLIETINMLASDPIDQNYSLSYGLNFQLGAGSLTLDETFSLSVSHLVPTSVDPNLSFDGTGINDAKLEDQFSIVDGAFDINGQSIIVLATDSINSVIDRINSSGLDVTATFEANETILLSHDISGAEDDIVLSNDTSGFLAATKLSNANSQVATGDESTKLADLEIMSGVTSGSLLINGTAIAFDVDTDSLADLIARIDVLVPDVEAEFDFESGLVSLNADGMENLEISSAGTGFFMAIGVTEGIYQASAASAASFQGSGLSYHSRTEAVRAVKTFARRFNAVFEDKYGETDPHLQKIRGELQQAITDITSADKAFKSSEKSNAFDVSDSFDFEHTAKEPFHFSDATERNFAKSLKSSNGAQQYQELFFENDNHDGVVERLLDIVGAGEKELRFELAKTGTIIDIMA